MVGRRPSSTSFSRANSPARLLDEHGDAAAGRGVDDGGGHLGEVGVADPRDGQPDQAAAPGAQRPGGDVGDVAQRLDRRLHLRAHRPAHRRVAVHDVGDGLDRDAGVVGDVPQSHGHASPPVRRRRQVHRATPFTTLFQRCKNVPHHPHRRGRGTRAAGQNRARPRLHRRARSTDASSGRSSSTWAGASTPASTSPATPPPTSTGSAATSPDLTREAGVSRGALPRRQLRLRLPLGGRRRPGRAPARAGSTWPGAASRPTRWASNEFVGWARRTGVEPMMAVNLGTRGVQEACDLLEYANHPGGTALSDLRARHGAPRAARHPAVVPGQRDGRPLADRAQDGRRVRPPRRRDRPGDAPGRPEHRARGLRQLQQRDADLRRVGGDRARPRLRRRRLHLPARLLRGARRRPRQLPRLARSTWTTSSDSVIATADHVGRQAAQPQADHLSFDEWNVWYQHEFAGHANLEPRADARASSRTPSRVADAVVVGGFLNSFLRHADRVKIACQAQLVNVIGLMRTEEGGPAWRQTIFHPFAQTARLARGTSLRVEPRAPRTRPPGSARSTPSTPARRGTRTPAPSPSSSSTGTPREPSRSPSTSGASRGCRSPSASASRARPATHQHRSSTARRAATAGPRRPRRRGVPRAAADPGVLDRRRAHLRTLTRPHLRARSRAHHP